DDHGAGAAYAMLAAQMDAGQSRLDAQKIAQGAAPFDFGVDALAVDREFDSVLAHAALAVEMSLKARVKIRRPTLRRYSAVAWRSSKVSVSAIASSAIERESIRFKSWPTSAASAFLAFIGVGPMPNQAMPARVTLPCSAAIDPMRPTSAKSPGRRATS